MLIADVVNCMNEEELKKSWDKFEPRFNISIENLIIGLFEEYREPFFDKIKIKSELINKFSKDKGVQFLVFKFIRDFTVLWNERFPDDVKLPFRISSISDSKTRLIKKQEFVSQKNKTSRNEIVNFLNLSASADHLEIYKSSAIENSVKNNHKNTGNSIHDISPTPSEKLTENITVALLPKEIQKNLTINKLSDQLKKSNIDIESGPIFHLPNCKVGVEFFGEINGIDRLGRKIIISDLKFPDKFGLKFDFATQTVTGQPILDGEFDLNLQWSFVGMPGKASGICKLISNPDPRSLWKVIEPSADLPYHKLHIDKNLIRCNGFNIVAASRRGRSHEHGGSFRDDDFFIFDDAASGWSVMIVADGAGSAKNSRQGSRLAVDVAGNYLVSNLAGNFGSKISDYLSGWDSDTKKKKSIRTKFHYFFHEMASAAVQAIESEAKDKNVPAKEYSTTLLVAAVKKDSKNTFLATFWMGDGAIAAYGPRGIVNLMGMPDGGEFAGQTRFLDRAALGDQGFGKRVEIRCLQDVSSIILLTDGVSDPYFETDNGLADPVKWDLLWDEIKVQLIKENPENLLADWLHFFKKGHHDDRTIAVLW